MSDDDGLVRNLRAAAELEGRALVRVAETAETFLTLRASRPAAVLLDLDLNTGAAWEAADRLLQEPNGPPVVLLTARTHQLDFKMAVRAGAVVDKSAEPWRLLEIAGQMLEAPRRVREETIALQRLLILQLNPFKWPLPIPAYRDFGINE